MLKTIIKNTPAFTIRIQTSKHFLNLRQQNNPINRLLKLHLLPGHPNKIKHLNLPNLQHIRHPDLLPPPILSDPKNNAQPASRIPNKFRHLDQHRPRLRCRLPGMLCIPKHDDR